MANNSIRFVPIRGTEEQINAYEKRNGQFYIATDTGKIFADISSEERIVLGNSGVALHYANTKPTQDSTATGVIVYLLDRLMVEDEATLKKNDLILNKEDGCFYQVISLNNITVTTIQLAVSGGSGGGGGGSIAGVMRFTPIGSQNIDVLEGQKCTIQFNFSAVDAAGDPTGAGAGIIYVNGVQKKTFSARQGDNSLDLEDCLEMGENNVIIQISGDVGGVEKQTQRKSWFIAVVHMTASWEYEETDLNTDDTFMFRWTISGNRLHQTHIIIDDGLYEILPPEATTATLQTYTINRAAYGLTHGAHKITLYATTDLNGEVASTNRVTHTAIFADEGNNIPIVAFAYYENSANQYDTINIPILAYDPTVQGTDIGIVLRDNGELVDTLVVANGSLSTWSYNALAAGVHRLSAALGNTSDILDLDIAELEINDTGKEIENYDFKFAANAFTSNEAIKNWESNGVSFTFSDNFDWINGGLKQELDDSNNVRNYLCIKAGSTVTLNYKLFNTLNTARGKVFKMIFKATNCRDYDAQVLECYDNETYPEHPHGLLMRAQNAILSNSANSLTIPYCEDSFIEFEFDIWGTQTAYGGHRYIIPWLDGVPAGIQTFDANTLFTQTKDIVIGSKDCDVYLYLMKVYNYHLTDSQHLANFIADALNAHEMLARYNRNNILDDNTGDISMTKLALANPNLKVHAYEISRMTTTKKDPVDGCSYRQYQGSATPELTAENVTIQVQGTSSSKYGQAAFNLDSIFNDGFTDANLQHIDNYAMTENSIPVNYFNTKVNVASCEGANNALNQRWYNTFQPYICEYRAKNPKARDTMDFPYPGVLFLKDNNQVVNSTGDHTGDNVFRSKDPNDRSYLGNPYYKMYSICNMGNSKKNKKVFHDPDNIYESCVEVADNQAPQQWMTSLAGVDRDNIDGDYYEFRYVPKGHEVEHSHAWYDFVNWLMHLDPSPYNESTHPYGYTEEELDEPETYGAYTFKGYTSAISNYTPANPVLKGTTISTYAGTYTHDTYERRMAKLLNECEDHMIMDAVVFHYLMCERHCLIDNIAKNTFWATEDMQHWAMIKDYDNDTSDGNDNEGKLTLTYGLEMLDQKASGSFVFNAPNSCWLHFIDGLYDARKTVYQALDNRGAWDDKTYLKMFEDYQSAIPERCWIEDYWRKYIRPLEVYDNDFFLDMLEGGKKTHQRKQFETYQAAYMSSKYMGTSCLNNFIMFRGEDAHTEAKFNMSMYADCYIQIDVGQQWVGPKGRGIRVKRNTPIEIISPMQDMKDATINFYLATYITKLTGLSTCVPQTANVGAATRLRELAVGGEHVNANLNSITFGANTLLEKLNLTNCTAINGSLSLDALLSLQELDIRGSSFSGVSVASNAPTETLHLNDLSTLDLKNLYHLSTFDMEDYSKLTTLIIDNIDNSEVNSRDIVELASGLNNYSLKNVQWTLDDANDIGGTHPAVIKILNTLLTKTPSGRDAAGSLIPATRAEALTGTLGITAAAYNNSDSNDIYDYYGYGEPAGFPNLDINFEGANAHLFTINIYDGNGDLCWSKKSNGQDGLTETFLYTGPSGDFRNIDFSNYQDLRYTYTFDHKWDIYNNNHELIIEQSGDLPTYTIFNTDLEIRPVYTAEPRLYDITFMSATGDIEYSTSYIYGTTLAEILDNDEVPYPYKDASELPLKECYAFKGYSLIPENGPILDANRYTIISDVVLYPQFEQASIYDSINPNLFEPVYISDEVGYIYRYDETNGNYGWNIYKAENALPSEKLDWPWNKTGIKLKPKGQLRGKIVIPQTFDIDGVTYDVVGLRGFTGLTELTHVFLQDAEHQEIRIIDRACFSECTSLNYFEFNSQLRTIEPEAFMNCALMPHTTVITQDGEEITSTIFSFGDDSNIASIGRAAFNNAIGRCTEGIQLVIPYSLLYLGYRAFSFLNKLASRPSLVIGQNSSAYLQLRFPDPDIAATYQNGWFVQNNGREFTQIIFANSIGTMDTWVDHDMNWAQNGDSTTLKPYLTKERLKYMFGAADDSTIYWPDGGRKIVIGDLD